MALPPAATSAEGVAVRETARAAADRPTMRSALSGPFLERLTGKRFPVNFLKLYFYKTHLIRRLSVSGKYHRYSSTVNLVLEYIPGYPGRTYRIDWPDRAVYPGVHSCTLPQYSAVYTAVLVDVLEYRFWGGPENSKRIVELPLYWSHCCFEKEGTDYLS
jgi:hypothetical protein